MRHPDFDDRIVAFADMLHGRTELYDDNSHGTHVSSIIGGSGRMSGGRYEGMAPKCQLVVVKVLDEKGNGNIGNVLHGIQWVLENRARFQIRIVNISVGTLPSVNEEGAEKLVQAVEALWDVGIVVVTAAGNYGPRPGSITSPGISKKVITVGSCDDQFYMEEGKKKRKSYSYCGVCGEAGSSCSGKLHHILQCKIQRKRTETVYNEERNLHVHASREWCYRAFVIKISGYV